MECDPGFMKEVFWPAVQDDAKWVFLLPSSLDHSVLSRAVKSDRSAVKDAGRSLVNLMVGNWTRQSVDYHRPGETKLDRQKGNLKER